VGPMMGFPRSDGDVDADVDGGDGSSSFLCVLGGWVNSVSDPATRWLSFFLSSQSFSLSSHRQFMVGWGLVGRRG